MKPTDVVTFDYTNHRGEQSRRVVRPIRIWYGSTAWHPEAQWMLEGFDVGKSATRDFIMSQIRNWSPREE